MRRSHSSARRENKKRAVGFQATPDPAHQQSGSANNSKERKKKRGGVAALADYAAPMISAEKEEGKGLPNLRTSASSPSEKGKRRIVHSLSRWPGEKGK